MEDSEKPLSREELTAVIEVQRDRIEELEGRIERLEQTLSDVEGQVDRTDEIVKQLNEGSIGGKAGVDLLTELAPAPTGGLTEARARNIYKNIVEDYRVEGWIKTSTVKKWLDLEHSTQAHRAMETLQQMCEDGILLGHIDIKKRRQQRCIRMTGTKDD
jgi:TolA-binding protein